MDGRSILSIILLGTSSRAYGGKKAVNLSKLATWYITVTSTYSNVVLEPMELKICVHAGDLRVSDIASIDEGHAACY